MESFPIKKTHHALGGILAGKLPLPYVPKQPECPTKPIEPLKPEVIKEPQYPTLELVSKACLYGGGFYILVTVLALLNGEGVLWKATFFIVAIFVFGIISMNYMESRIKHIKQKNKEANDKYVNMRKQYIEHTLIKFNNEMIQYDELMLKYKKALSG